MAREIVSLQVGQCGNKIGTEFWKQVVQEHGINKDGSLVEDNLKNRLNNNNLKNNKLEDKKDVFFYENEGHYYPRALLFDLEPRVVQGILSSDYKNLFKRDNVFLSKEGNGAGNNWGIGYSYSEKHKEDLLNLIDKEADNADNLEGFILSHSIGGGTGSGMGSYLLELLSENYSKKIIKTFSVFPQLNNSSDVVVQPYNSILALKRLVLNSDMVTVLDNTVLNNSNSNSLNLNKNSQHSNSTISNIMTNFTSCLRYYNNINNNLVNLVSSLVIVPRCHFLVTSVVSNGFYDFERENSNKMKLFDVIRSLYQPSNILVSSNLKNGKFMSVLNILRGKNTISPVEINKSIEKIKERNLVNFIKWNPASIQVNVTKQSKLSNEKLSGLLLANHTSIHELYEENVRQFDKLYNRRAFLDNYRKVDLFSSSDGNGNFEEMDHSREVVELVKDEYVRAEQDDYYNLSCK